MNESLQKLFVRCMKIFLAVRHKVIGIASTNYGKHHFAQIYFYKFDA